MPILQTTKA
jgi:NADPH:quinone reductase-like Zn-dependent oxidoreductase